MGIIASFIPETDSYQKYILDFYIGKIGYRSDTYNKTYRNGLLHSFNDQPAVSENNRKIWYSRGKIHRDQDLPAVIHDDGTQEWYQHGKKHRIEKPAYVEPIGISCWYLNGSLHRNFDLPAVKHSDGSSFWYFNGRIHRSEKDQGLTLPAVEYADGTQKWYQRGSLHREDRDEHNKLLPAVIWPDDFPTKYEYWVYGRRLII